MDNQPSEKRKLKYQQVDLDNYLDLDLEEYKDSLFRNKRYHENEVSIINNKIKEANYLIAKKCLKVNGSHEWVSERENCMYGQRYTFCKKCRVDYYNNEYFHY